MAKHYILKVKGTWLDETSFNINAQGLDRAYCIGPEEGGGMAITRKQYEAIRFTRRAKLEVDEKGGLAEAGGGAFFFVGLSTKASRLKKRAEKSFEGEGEDGFIYLECTSGLHQVYASVEADVVLDVLSAAGF